MAQDDDPDTHHVQDKVSEEGDEVETDRQLDFAGRFSPPAIFFPSVLLARFSHDKCSQDNLGQLLCCIGNSSPGLCLSFRLQIPSQNPEP